MNFKDFYQQGKLSLSFEIFPPKTEKGKENLFEALRDLSKFDPAFISVTYGSGGSTRDLTRDLAIQIGKEVGLTTAFHFTCVGSDRKTIQDYVEYLKKEGLNLVVALRGDPPKGESQFVKPADGFSYASELVGFLREINGFSIAVAGYPEGHIECRSKEEDLIHLREKVDAGADVVITQLFFDNRDFFDFVVRARKIGIKVPIIPGIMPILNIDQLKRITGLCGAKVPSELLAELEKNKNNDEAMREIGIRHALNQCQELVEKGVPGVHFYILNKSYSTKKIIESLKK